MIKASRCRRCGAGYVGQCPVCKNNPPEPRSGRVVRKGDAKHIPVRTEPVGTHLASMIPGWAKSMKGGCQCSDWEAKMNRWGASGCESRREEIVNHLASQSDQLVPPLAAVPKGIKKVVASKMLDKAIRMAVSGPPLAQ